MGPCLQPSPTPPMDIVRHLCFFFPMTRRFFLPIIAVLSLDSLSAADEDANTQDPAAAFTAMLENATLNGSWAPIDKRLLGDEKQDGYHIVKARPQEGDTWKIFYKMKIQGREIVYPIPVTIKFAGDTAVMILNNSPVGVGQTWSARILFHDDVYAGSWWNKGKTKGGIVSGTITRATKK